MVGKMDNSPFFDLPGYPTNPTTSPLCVCVCVCKCVFVFTHTHTHTHTLSLSPYACNTHTHSRRHTHTLPYVSVCVRVFVGNGVRVCVQACARAFRAFFRPANPLTLSFFSVSRFFFLFFFLPSHALSFSGGGKRAHTVSIHPGPFHTCIPLSEHASLALCVCTSKRTHTQRTRAYL